ncbi:HNH endonuclease [Haloplanus salinarum]|uniref:HNH endonuclease n=1 Tax=Haloplanus salinarum TaxID=1912324 RepID=UPI00214BFBFB|nr:HNH endonuclease [Haloplanus salinarum]
MSEAWSRDEHLVVLNAYLNDGVGSNDPEARELANQLDRSEGSITSRLANYRSLDSDGPEGLSGISQLGREVWNEFHEDKVRLAREAAVAKERLAIGADEDDVVRTSTGTSVTVVRQGQSRFRERVRERYGGECLLCGVDDPSLLEAAHVVSWEAAGEDRGDPANGLLLCGTHHRAFDEHIFTISEDYTLELDPAFETDSRFLERTIVSRDGERIDFGGTPPDSEYLGQRNGNQRLW